jgi:hypothetical protein
MMLFLLIVIVFVYLQTLDAYSIKLESGQKECFSIDLKVGQPCSGSYEVITEDAEPIIVTVIGPDGQLHYQSGSSAEDAKKDPEEDADSGDAFQFDAEVEGEYTMCLNFDKNLGDNSDNQLSRTLAFNFRATNSRGSSGEYNGLESELDALQRGLDSLKDHHAYMSQREDVHKNELDKINFQVLCWTVLESVILIATAIWQISYIGSFFETKRRL